jgi:hypothetical protein
LKSKKRRTGRWRRGRAGIEVAENISLPMEAVF